MADLSVRISLLATRVANYIRDSVLPRLTKPGGTVGQVLTKNSSTNYDYSWITPASAGTITSLSSSLSADVPLATASTWYDGPSVSLPAGTWLVMGQITHVRFTTTAETIFKAEDRQAFKDTMQAIGVNDYELEIGNSEFFRSACAAVHLNEEQM